MLWTGRWILLLLCVIHVVHGEEDSANQYRRYARKKIRLEDEMEPQTFNATGMRKLSRQELRLLEDWLVKFISKELDNSDTTIIRINDIDIKTSVLTLTDGSVWQVSPFDRRTIRSWTQGQRIEVMTKRDVRGRVKLLNRATRDTITAEILYQMPEDQKPDDKVRTITKINRYGDHITLDDGSVWRVILADKYRARRWTGNQKIQVRPDKFSNRKAELYNINLQESVQAEMLYGPRPQKDEE